MLVSRLEASHSRCSYKLPKNLYGSHHEMSQCVGDSLCHYLKHLRSLLESLEVLPVDRDTRELGSWLHKNESPCCWLSTYLILYLIAPAMSYLYLSFSSQRLSLSPFIYLELAHILAHFCLTVSWIYPTQRQLVPWPLVFSLRLLREWLSEQVSLDRQNFDKCPYVCV